MESGIMDYIKRNKMKKDLPIYINGFAVTYLFIETNMSITNWVMFLLAAISFLYYSKNHK